MHQAVMVMSEHGDYLQIINWCVRTSLRWKSRTFCTQKNADFVGMPSIYPSNTKKAACSRSAMKTKM